VIIADHVRPTETLTTGRVNGDGGGGAELQKMYLDLTESKNARDQKSTVNVMARQRVE
jgi:hypothetical protein